MNAIRFFLFLRKLAKRKRELLWEARCDLEYFNRYKAKLLKPDFEDKARKRLGEESEKPKPNAELVNQLTEDITQSRAIKTAYYKTLNLTQELPVYIADLEARQFANRAYANINELGRRVAGRFSSRRTDEKIRD